MNKKLVQNFPKNGYWIYHSHHEKIFGSLSKAIDLLFNSQQGLSGDIDRKQVARLCQHHGFFACGINVIHFVPTDKKYSSDYYQR